MVIFGATIFRSAASSASDGPFELRRVSGLLTGAGGAGILSVGAVAVGAGDGVVEAFVLLG